MIRAHAEPCCHGRKRVSFPDQRDDFIDDIMKILFLPGRTPGIVAALVRPAVLIDRIDDEKLDLSLFQKIRKFPDHSELFKVAALGILGGKPEDRDPAVSIDHHLHIFLKMVTEVPDIFLMQNKDLFSFDAIYCMHTNHPLSTGFVCDRIRQLLF